MNFIMNIDLQTQLSYLFHGIQQMFHQILAIGFKNIQKTRFSTSCHLCRFLDPLSHPPPQARSPGYGESPKPTDQCHLFPTCSHLDVLPTFSTVDVLRNDYHQLVVCFFIVQFQIKVCKYLGSLNSPLLGTCSMKKT